MYNAGLIFYEDGKDLSYTWGRMKDGFDELRLKLIWERLDEQTIRIRYLEEEDWEEVG